MKVRTWNGRVLARVAAVVVAGGGLALGMAGIGSATSYGPPYTVPLHQPTPITAAGFGTHETQCGNIPTTEDGWHFVLPGDFTVFVSLTVTFSPGGTQTITTFGPPSAKHAFAGSAAGATLESASAIVKTETGKTKVLWFNLSHTCPATGPSPSPSPSGTPTGTPSVTPSVTPSTSVSPSPSPSPSESEHPGPAPTPTPEHETLPVTG